MKKQIQSYSPAKTEGKNTYFKKFVIIFRSSFALDSFQAMRALIVTP